MRANGVAPRVALGRGAPHCELVVVKVAERCNLNCSYCYMFNGGDVSYRRRPALMSVATADSLVTRVAAHCRRHDLSRFAFVLHGGEPLLARPPFYRHLVDAARRTLPAGVAITFALQTNG